MKVLVLDEEFPYPANTGKRTRSYNLYRRLAGRFDIAWVGYGDAASPAAQALRAQGIEPRAVAARVPPKQGAGFYLRLLANLASPLPYIVTSHDSPAYRAAVREALRRFRPDLVVCEWTPYALHARGLTATRTLVTAHNIEADIWRRYHETESNPARRWYIRRQWRKVERFERTALGWVDAAVAVSAADRTRLAAWRPGLATALVPNGVDLDYFRPAPPAAPPRHLVFSGSMDWRPNQDAMRWFAAEVLPRLRRARPGLECTFVGRDPPGDLRALAAATPGLRLTGTVDDVRPYLERAAVYVVPLRVGGGSRLKILEALAMGLPVVSTRVGAEGLAVEEGRHLLLADDPGAFADAVQRLLDDLPRGRALGKAGRALVERRYGWDALAARLGDFMEATVGGGRKRSSETMERTALR